MADDIKITRNVYVENNNDPVNQYVLANGLAREGEPIDRLMLENGDLVLVRDINRIIQQIYVGLRLLVADWVLDVNAGINYLGGLRAYPEILSAQIKRAINSVDGVDTVLKYNFYQDDNNIVHVSCTVKVGNSEIAVNEDINLQTLGV
jgi:hypothetical protein